MLSPQCTASSMERDLRVSADRKEITKSHRPLAAVGETYILEHFYVS